MPHHPALSPEECREARLLIRWQTVELAERAAVPLWAVERYEQNGSPSTVVPALLAAFSRAGVTFDVLGNPQIDELPYNTRTDNGVPTRFTCTTPTDECLFRHPPLPMRSFEGG